MELVFDDDWMDKEPLHRAAVDATGEIIGLHNMCDPTKIENAGSFLFHFMSCWYVLIVEGNGALVKPAVDAIAWFTDHMVSEHDMPVEQAYGCSLMLTRFVSLVITKTGGKLI